MRPKIVSGTPLEYKVLMEQCWDADPTKRPDIEEQEVFHSKTYNYNIPYNIDDFINKNNDNATKSINIIEDDNKELSEVTENMQINYSNSNNVQNDYKKEIIQQVKKHNIDYIDDENEIYNNPNLHSEEQDELEIPDDGF
ncbi:unnamed protein product [Rhizophagus irregularis]|nr:unnamed protein product [Rhizophagus irregularis]